MAAAPRSEFALGWQVLLASSIGIAFGASPVPYNAIGHLVQPLQDEFGWGRGEIMFAVTLLGLTVTLLSPIFGTLVDRLGVRPVALGSCLLFSLCFGAIALTPNNIVVFYALFIMTAVLGGASIPISWTRGVNAWFVRNRGLALALALMGTGVASVVINNLAPWLNAEFGWRGLVLGLAALGLFISLPLAVLFFREPRAEERPAAAAEDPAADGGLTLREAAREARFWLMGASFLIVALVYGGLFANFVPLLRDDGFSAAQAGVLASALGIFLVVGRIVAGWLLDRFWAPLVAFPLLSAPAVSCLLLAHDGITPFEAWLAAGLLGFAAGAETDLVAYLSARYYGLKHYGKIYGALYAFFGIGSSLSPPIYGWVFDTSGSYIPMLYVAAVSFVIGASLLLFIGRYPTSFPGEPSPEAGAAALRKAA
jgi:predicted MFS family arabinose efflux permease